MLMIHVMEICAPIFTTKSKLVYSNVKKTTFYASMSYETDYCFRCMIYTLSEYVVTFFDTINVYRFYRYLTFVCRWQWMITTRSYRDRVTTFTSGDIIILSKERSYLHNLCHNIIKDKLYCCRVLLIYNLFPLSVSAMYYTHKNGNLAREDHACPSNCWINYSTSTSY